MNLSLALASASALGERLWVLALLSRLAWVIVLILRPGRGNLHPVLSKMTSFSDIFCLFFILTSDLTVLGYMSLVPSDASSSSVWIIITIILFYYHFFSKPCIICNSYSRNHNENKVFLPALCYPSYFLFLVPTVAAIHIPINVKYNFSFSL